jgi:hypothetical protein
METIDKEFTADTLDLIEREHKAGRRFFWWWNSTGMDVFTHLKKVALIRSGGSRPM